MRRALLSVLALAASLQAATPVVTSFTASTSSPVQGQTFSICWVASNVPTSITITPGLTGNNTTTYVDSTNPASGCATFTPPIARLRTDGDSLTCGFRATGSAQNTGITGAPCNPNPNPNGAPNFAWPVRARVNLQQLGYSVPVYENVAVVGATAQGHTALTCTGSIYNPDILAITYGANDVQSKTLNSQMDTIYTSYLKPLWSAALSSGCVVVPWTITPRSNNPNPDSVRVYLNGLITGTPALYSGVIDIGNTSDVMGCAGCNTTATAYFNTTDTTHYTDLGYQHAGDLASAVLAPLMKATYTITANNASGTSAAVTLQVSVKRAQASNVLGGMSTTK